MARFSAYIFVPFALCAAHPPAVRSLTWSSRASSTASSSSALRGPAETGSSELSFALCSGVRRGTLEARFSGSR